MYILPLYFYQAYPPKKNIKIKKSSHDRIEKKFDSFIKLYRSLGVSVLNMGSVSS